MGATGSIGSAFVNALLRSHTPVTILVRERLKAHRLFGSQPLLETIEGDALDGPGIKAASSGKNYIFHGINYPYNKWAGNMERVTVNVIKAAAQNKALILFPGNVYNFGMISPIFEDSSPAPIAKKGAIRVGLERILQESAKANKCKVLILRLPDFFGPNVINGLMQPIFTGALRGKTMRWIGRIDIPHQLAYIHDVADIFWKLIQRGAKSNFDVINYGGAIVPSIRSWFEVIARNAETAPKIRSLPGFAFAALGLFSPLVREIKEMLYLFENTIVLDDEKLKSTLPDFRPTPMPEAIKETLNWFRANSIS